MVDEDPVDLEQKAERYLRIAKRITDDRALHALHDMAQAYRLRADEARARHQHATQEAFLSGGADSAAR